MKTYPLLGTVSFSVLLGLLTPTVADSKPKKKLEGRIHFVAKGDVRLRLGDTELGYRDHEKSKLYIDGLTRYHKFEAGDVLIVRMRSEAVYRHIVLAIESKKKFKSIPIRRSDLRYLGEETDLAAHSHDELSEKDLPLKADTADLKMNEMWNEHGLSKPARDRSDWIKLPYKGVWHTYAVMITPEMLKR